MLEPQNDRLVVKRDPTPDKSKGGIILAEDAKEKPIRGTVVSVGKGRKLENNSRWPIDVKVGDKVVFAAYGPITIQEDGDEFLVLREDDVLAVIR